MLWGPCLNLKYICFTCSIRHLSTDLPEYTIPDSALLYMTTLYPTMYFSTWHKVPDNALLYMTLLHLTMYCSTWPHSDSTILYLTILLFYLTTLYLRVYWSTWQCTALPDYTVSDTVLLYQISLVRHLSLVRCCADIVRTYISRDICPHYILLQYECIPGILLQDLWCNPTFKIDIIIFN